tara:strand:- start:382 stop:729 length:348 start_codon:yes stop_codon:yes gene_type:complete
MKYQKLKDQSNLHWYEFNDGTKVQINKLSKMIAKLFNKENLTISEVAKKINMDKETVTHVIRKLCVKSILNRQCGGKNKQTVYFKNKPCLLHEIYTPKSILKNFKILRKTVHKAD